MKTELKAKFIQQIISKKKDNEGFTLIELLVVIIIIGILSAIALPSFLNQAAKAKQSEAKTYVGSTNRAQQAYRIENTAFAANLDNLQLGIPSTTEYYAYTMGGGQNTATILATAIDATALKGFSGGVVIITTGATTAVACQTQGVQSQKAVGVPTLTTSATALTTAAASCIGTMEIMK